jgi:hypothetical protein
LRNKFILEIAFSLLTRIILTPRIKGGNTTVLEKQEQESNLTKNSHVERHL